MLQLAVWLVVVALVVDHYLLSMLPFEAVSACLTAVNVLPGCPSFAVHPSVHGLPKFCIY